MSDERLPPKLELLLAAERASAPPDGERDEVAERLAKTLGLAALTAVATSTPAGAQAANAAAGGFKAIVAKSLATKILVAVVVGGTSVGGIVGTVRIARHHRHASTTRAIATPAIASPTPHSATTAPLIVPTTSMEAPQPNAVPPATSSRHSEPHRSRHSDLIAERSLLTDARTAMQSGDAARALTILDEHAHRFAHGQLAEERDALEVVALARAGDQKRARVRAEEFVRRHPNSLFLPSVQQAATE